MKLRAIIAAVITAIMFTQPLMAQMGGPSGTIAYITFNEDVFEEDLNDALSGNVMGYQWVLIKDGQMALASLAEAKETFG